MGVGYLGVSSFLILYMCVTALWIILGIYIKNIRIYIRNRGKYQHLARKYKIFNTYTVKQRDQIANMWRKVGNLGQK